MLNFLHCIQVCEMQLWKQAVYCKLNLCSVKEFQLKIMKTPSTQYPGERTTAVLGIFLMGLLMNSPVLAAELPFVIDCLNTPKYILKKKQKQNQQNTFVQSIFKNNLAIF